MNETDNKKLITEILSSFKVHIESIEEHVGPSTTLYEIVPRIGTRISKIRNLADEIAVGLKADNVRVIAPLPNKGTVGIEVPNKERKILQLNNLLSSREYAKNDAILPLVLGKTVTGDTPIADLTKMPHLLIAGATGQGKSVCLNDILISLMEAKRPQELGLLLIDPKQVELSVYQKAKPYLLQPVCTTVQDAYQQLANLILTMELRYTLLAKEGVRNIEEYNAKVADNPLQYFVCVIDEYGDLVMQAGNAFTNAICRLAQKSRAVGIHLIISTQRPSVRIVTGDIKANFPTRIAFRTVTSTDSKVVLGKKGAEKLTSKGDMLFFNGEETVRVQCPYVSTDEVNSVCEKKAKEFADYVRPIPHQDEIEVNGVWRQKSECVQLYGKWYWKNSYEYHCTMKILELQEQMHNKVWRKKKHQPTK